jgi:uncharacterized membrane-anchored protein
MKEGMQIPVDHPERFNLNDEVHARPPEPLPTPCRVSYLALYTDWHLAPSDLEPVTELARRFQAVEPRPSSNHYSADFGRFRLRWERHTEYTRYTFIAPGVGEDLFAEPAIQLVPEDWLQSLPGSVLVAKHATLVRPEGAPSDPDLIAARFFGGNVLLGSDVGAGAGLLSACEPADRGIARTALSGHPESAGIYRTPPATGNEYLRNHGPAAAIPIGTGGAHHPAFIDSGGY